MTKNKYNILIKNHDFFEYLKITKNSIYKLLCLYEEKNDWKKSLQTILFEIAGVHEVFYNKIIFIKIIGKLESLNSQNMTPSFFRKTIFEVLTLIDGEIDYELSESI